ncbi:uncharacterized protein LOC131956886 [Physella acuta]|uniref:uncharacterized protein LOC131956886 n=1 Tax=Physella acuta TaxID=109671 RepID=UPI0027DBE393|nr:uncharacterized protein LOC131956886 [Physella acuta]
MRASAPHSRLTSACSYDSSSGASSSSSDESSARCRKCSWNSSRVMTCPSRHVPHCRLVPGTKRHQVSDHTPGESASGFQHHEHNCRSDVCRSEVCRSDVFRSDVCRSDVCRSDVCRSDVCRSDVCRSDVCRSDVCRSDVCRSDVGRSDVCRSDVCRSEVCRSDVCRSDVCRSDVCRSDVCRSDVCGKCSLKRCYSPEEISDGCLDLKSDHDHSKYVENRQLENHQCTAEKSSTRQTHKQCSGQEDLLHKEQHQMCYKVEICGNNVNVRESPYNSDDCVRNKKQNEFHSDADHCAKPRQTNPFLDSCSENTWCGSKPSRINQSKNADNSEKKESEVDKKVPSRSSTDSSCLEDHLPKSFCVKPETIEDKTAMLDKSALISRFPEPSYSSCLPNLSLSLERYSYAPICVSGSKWNLPYICRPVCGSLLRLSSRTQSSCSRFQSFPRRRPSCGHSFCQPGACCLKYSLTNPVCHTYVRYTSCFDPCRSTCVGHDPLCGTSWTSCSSTGSDPKPYTRPSYNFPKYGTSSFKTLKEEPEKHDPENSFHTPPKGKTNPKSTPQNSYNSLRPPSPPLPTSKLSTPKHSIEFRPPSPPIPRSKAATPRHSIEFRIPEDEEHNKVSIPSPNYPTYQHVVVKTVETYTQSTLTAPIMVDKFTQVDVQVSNQSTGTDVTDTSSKYTNTEPKELADKSTEFYTTETSTKNFFPTCFIPSLTLPCCLGTCDTRKRLCFTPFEKFRNPFQRTPSYRQTVRCLDIYRSVLGENTETDVLSLSNNPARPKNKCSPLKNRDWCYVYR